MGHLECHEDGGNVRAKRALLLMLEQADRLVLTYSPGRFAYMDSFNGDISKWDTSSVTDMCDMCVLRRG